MKKIAFVLILIAVLAASIASAKNYMYAKRYGFWEWTGLAMDHTYHCANDGSETDCWSWTGGQSAGSYIPYTWGYGNFGDARCTTTNWGRRFVYLVQGVCHQETNRGLYTSGKTVKYAAGYWASKAAFGTYGKMSSWMVCKTACWLWW